MPYPYAIKLLLWPSSCEEVDVSAPLEVRAEPDENVFLLLTSGQAEIVWEKEVHSLNMEGICVLGRDITVTVSRKGEHPCRMMVLQLRTVKDPPYIDLNHLCLTMPTIDSFFTYKQRFCILQDYENSRLTFNAISDEIRRKAPEWEKMMNLRLQELLIGLARSFCARTRLAGIQKLSVARDFIRTHYQETLNVDAIADHTGVSRSYLAQLFSVHLGYGIVDYIQAVRCDHAAYLLRTTRFAVLDIALEVGYNSRQHFTRTFIKIYGMTPRQYRITQRPDPRRDRSGSGNAP